jgi:hypothetical protein
MMFKNTHMSTIFGYSTLENNKEGKFLFPRKQN